MIPFFTSHYSIGRSLLTLDEPEEIKENTPISIFSIAKTHNLDKTVVVDTSMTGFCEAYQNAAKANTQLIYGIKFVVCANSQDKSDDSLKTESKVIVVMLNSNGYKDLCKMYSKSWKNKYYVNRLDWNELNSMWSPNLRLFIPFYDSFLSQNLLENGNCVPQFGEIKPTMCFGPQELPFDFLLENSVKKYAESNSLDILKTRRVLYYKNDDFKALQVYRIATGRAAITGKASLEVPNINHYSSNKFSFESFLENK